MMKRLIGLIALAAMAWSGFWLAGYWGVSKGVPAWFEARQSDGWVAEYENLSVRGFPSRLDSTLTNLSLADPDTSIAWDAPFFQFFALTYRPHHVIAVWPNTQTVSTPEEKLTVSTADMRASLVLTPGTDLTLERSNLAIEGLAIQSSTDWELRASAVKLAMHRQEDSPARYRLAFQADDLAPTSLLNLPDEIDLPRSFSSFQADLTAEFTRPWDRTAIEQDRPQPIALDLTLAEIIWGDLELNAAGSVTIDDIGIPTGEVTIRAVNWRDMLAVARQSEHVPTSIVDTLEQALGFVAGLSGNANTLDIPLTFKRGTTHFGPLPIGPAPRIVLQ
ncbi:DUF2125 domain-containing protein [Shimia sp. R10_1]|uniref:DUF2125 domain-containing protein n=1 Tax=Shimia sp. R10_1 TaxID=2821095 RepID=UPI001ADA6FCB|nr:DUF2125 domain-containing protein [Shimia sp. R10_1]MBO9474480.1 DUF2125 domain-containing protein [Shimia sp. R10_1]